MPGGSDQDVLAQLNQIEHVFRDLDGRKPYNDFSGLPEADVARFQTMCLAAIDRIAGAGSAYARQAANAIEHRHLNWSGNIPILFGITEALRQDVQNGYLMRIAELIHADLFSDFLEMAEHLLHEQYKDASAVLIGGVLEGHLRQLCQRFTLDTEIGGRPKKADTINADLARAGAYSKLDQKSITAWLDLRNKAAHGKYGEYDAQQVALFLQGVRNFLSSHPA